VICDFLIVDLAPTGRAAVRVLSMNAADHVQLHTVLADLRRLQLRLSSMLRIAFPLLHPHRNYATISVETQPSDAQHLREIWPLS
jgi:hypothetical protein